MTATQDLLNIMSLHWLELEGIMRTPDGCYMGQDKGDIGYNIFIGKSALVHEGPGRRRAREVWLKLSKKEQMAVRVLAAAPPDGSPIPLADFGIVP